MAKPGLFGRKRSTMLNALSMGIYQLLTILLGFLIPRLLLTTYGADLHGYTSTTSTVMGYVALLNMGLSVTALQSLYKPLADGDNRRISSVLNAIDLFYTKTGILYTIAIIACAVIMPWVISADISTGVIVALMFVTGATSTMECFIYSKHRVLLQADQRFYIVNIVDTLALAIRGAIQICLMLMGQSIVLVQAIPLVMVFPRMIALTRYVRRHYPNLDRHQPPDVSALSKRRSVFVHQIAGLVSNNTDVVLLSVFSSMKAVSVFSVYNLVFSHLYTLLTNMFSNGVVASFGQVIEERRRDAVLQAFEIYEFIYYMCISVVYSTAAIMILPFVSLYTEGVEGAVYRDPVIAALFVSIGVLNNIRIPCNTMINASGHFKETSWRATLEAVINLGVSLVLFPFLGVYGLLIGTLASFLYRTPDTIRYSNKYILHRRYRRSVVRLLRVLVIICLNIWIWQCLIGVDVHDWLGWCVTAVMVMAGSSIVVVLLNGMLEMTTMNHAIHYIFGNIKKISSRQNISKSK